MGGSGHNSETKACILSAAGPNLTVGSSSQRAQASQPELPAQCWGKEGWHTPQLYFILTEKQREQNGNCKLSSGLQIFKLMLKTWR